MTPNMKRIAKRNHSSCEDLLKRLEGAFGPSVIMTRNESSGVKKIQKPELMPQNFSEYKGQDRIKMLLLDAIHAAVKRGEPIEHILFNGLAGQGKTTLAWLLAQEAGRAIVTVTSSTLQKPIDIYNLFKDIEKEKFPIIFLDEIQGLSKSLAEMLYLPMENPNMEMRSPSSYGSCNFSVIIKPFTLIGSTAGEAGRIPKPMLDRFQIKLNMDPYTIENIGDIITQSCNKIKLNLTSALIGEVTQRSTLIPRKANNLLRIISNHVVANNIKKIDKPILEFVFKLLELDDMGIDRIGRRILKEIASSPKGSIGVQSLAAIIGVDTRTLIRCHEPDLLALSLIRYMPGGRSITEDGLKYIKKYIKAQQ
jgi:Holliday junction DNA helicase RuvB